jgi:hypothetical protein
MRLVDADAGAEVFEAKAKSAMYDGELRWVIPISELDKLPTIDAVEVVHSRWVLRQSNGYAVCSQCCRGDYIDPIATHCRYCGAKMDLED